MSSKANQEQIKENITGIFRITRAWLLVFVIITALFASVQVAEAAGTPTKLITFTDKKVYTDFYFQNGRNALRYEEPETDNFVLYVYAIVLDDTGAVIYGREGSLSGVLDDTERLDHYDGGYETHHSITSNPNFYDNIGISFVDDGSITGDTAGDGVYVARLDLDEMDGAALVEDHLRVNISVTDSTVGTEYTEVLFSGEACHNGETEAHGTHAGNDGDGTTAACAICHHGYEHFYEDISGTFPEDQLDVHFGKMIPTDTEQTKSIVSYVWNMSWLDADTFALTGATATWSSFVPGSEYCQACHFTTSGAAITDYGAGDRTDLADTPSCNVASKTLDGVSITTVTCHATTNITGATVPDWLPVAAVVDAGTSNYDIVNATSHGHDESGALNVPCVLCHQTMHGLTMPNLNPDNYSDIADQCHACHASYEKHNYSVSCTVCHSTDQHNISFLQGDQSFDITDLNAVACSDCHENESFGTALGINPQIVPPTKHSDDSDAGQKWGDYWTSENQLAQAVDGNLIYSSLSNVSNDNVIIGAVSGYANAMIADAIFETLTEGWAATIDEYTYVSSNSTPWGTITNWANIQSSSDAGAVATFTEEFLAADSSDYFGTYISTDAAAAAGAAAGAPDDITAVIEDRNYVEIGTPWGNIRDTGIITQVFGKVRSTDTKADTTWIVPSTSATEYQFTTTIGLANYSADITAELGSWTWTDAAVLNLAYWEADEVDAVWLNVAWSDTYELDSVLTFNSVPEADNYYMQLYYKVSAGTYDVFVFNGSDWTDRGDLTSTTLTWFNYTLSEDEYNNGNPKIKLKGNGPDAVQDNVQFDFARINSYTGGDVAATSHYELDITQNVTDVPTFKNTNYYLTIKGLMDNTDNLDLEIWNFDSNSYRVYGISKFKTTNQWYNLSIDSSSVNSTGDVIIRYVDSNQSRYDDVQDTASVDYAGIRADTYKFLPCQACHALNKHSSDAKGHVGYIEGSNELNTTDSANSRWCANCHISYAPEYNGTELNPAPPTITTDNTGGVDGWYNHSGDVSGGYNDSVCLACHGNITTSSVAYIHDIMAGQSGSPDCIACHKVGDSVANVDFTNMANGAHGNLNNGATNSSYLADNKKCWACHGTLANGDADETDQPAGGHNTSIYTNPRICSDCHENTDSNTNFSAPQVVEHIPGATDVPTTDQCSLCHNNSLTAITESDGFGINSVINATSAHYLTDANTNLMTTTAHSEDCVWCHYTNPNNASWGTPINASSTKSSLHNMGQVNSDCYTCHVDSKTEPATMHVAEMNAGVGSGPNCMTCHNTSDVSTDYGHIDYNIYNTSLHGVLSTNDSITDANEACWACHGDGTSEGHNTTGDAYGKGKYKNPYICEDCHVSGGDRYSWATGLSTTPAMVVEEHYTGATDISASGNANTTYSCLVCHEDTGEMMLSNADPDANLTAWSGGGDGYGSEIGNSTSSYHYGKKRTDMGTGDAYCNYCHNNASASSEWIWIDSAHNTSIKEHTTNGSADVNNATTLNCDDCHSTGRIHNSTLTTPVASDWDASGGVDKCAPCHISSDAGSTLYVSNSMHNTSANIADCGVCHNSDAFATGNAYISVHSDNLTAVPPAVADTCTECHTNTTWVSMEIREHTDDGTANVNAPSMTCNNSSCHVSAAAHSSSLTTPATTEWTAGMNDMCAPCHEGGDSNATKYVYDQAHNPTNADAGDITGCGYCHNATSQNPASFGIHDADMQANVSGYSTCVTCHNGTSTYVDTDIIYTHFPGAPTDKGDTSESGRDCEECHALSVGDSMHASGMVSKPTDGCVECHQTKSSLYNATTGKATIGSYAHDKSAWGNDTTDCNWCHNNTNDPQNFHFTQWANGTISNPGAWTWAAGDSPNCIDCHNNNTTAPFYANVPAVDHTDNINDSTWGIDDCYSCHTSAETYASDPKAMHFIDPAPANANCTQCHDVDGEASKQVDIDAMNNSDSIHNNLNSGASNGDAVEPYATESKRCWACHGDGTAPTTHPTNFKNPYVCEDCHTTGGTQYSNYTPAYVTDHIQTGLNASTDVNTTDYCTVCHNNSIAITINDPNVVDAMDIVSHYGTNASLMTASNNSLDCKYCHMDNTNNVTWGNATYFTEHQGTTTASPNSECYTCHNTSDSVSITNLHATEMDAGVGAGPDCIACHNTPSGPKSYGLIDFSVSNNSNAIHKMVNQNVTSSYDSVNYQCWGCHGNGSEPASGTHPSNYKNPYICEDCHVSSGSRFTWATSLPVPAFAVDEHYTGASNISASVNANTTQSCLKCHEDTAEMVLSNSDTDNVSGWVGDNYNINGGNTSAYHYGSKRSDLTPDTDAYCNYCHNNASASSEWIWVDSAHNTTILEHTADGSANLTNATTLNCADCHSTGRIHNSTLTTPTVSGWSGATNSVCAPCHETDGSGSLMKVASHNTTTTGITDCSECHNSENPGASGGYQGVHSSNLTNGTGASYDSCTECHTDAGTIFVTDAIKTHYKGASAGKADTTTYECEQCHNLSVGTSMHTDGMTIPTEGCNECHNDTGSTIYDSTILVQNLNHDNSSYGGTVTCNTCHDTASEPAQFHFTDYPNGTVQNTSWKSPDVLVNCIDCHSNNSEVNPYSAEPTSYHEGTYGDNLDDCYDCHTTAATANDANAPEAMHNVTVSSVWDNCIDCHASTAKNGAPVMDNTQIGNGIHQGLNGGGNDACTACHGVSENHYSIAKDCDYCHMNGSDIYNSLQVTEHYPSASNLPTYTAQGDNESCITCHNMTEMVLTYTDDSSGTGYAIVSHYGAIRTDMGSGDAYCEYCHSNSTSAFLFDNATNKAINEHTTNTSASVNDVSMSCESCHGAGRIHNNTLTTPAVTKWTTSAADYCAPCHVQGDSNATKYVYEQGHDPNYSQSDRIGDCGFCHNSSSQGVNGTTLRVHSENLINGTSTPAYQTCKGCHNGTDIFTGTGKQVFSHIPNASQYRGNTTTSGYTCESCHNMSDKPSMHSAGMDLSDGDCDTCHFTRTSLFNSTQKIIHTTDYNHTYSGQATCNVSQCHNASGDALGFHLDKYAAGIVGDPERINSVWNDRNDVGNGFTDTPYVDCIDCHGVHNDTAPFTNSPDYEANLTGEDAKIHTSSDSIDTCYNCHTNRTDANDRYMVHNVTIEPLEGGPACLKCHNESAPTTGGYASINNRVNVTAFNLSVHKNFTNATAWNASKTTGSILLDSACWACHASDISDIPANSHPDRGGPSAERTYQCEECHTIGGNISNYNPELYQNATKVYRHYAGKEFIGVISFNSSTYCFECHRNSLITDTNISYGSYQYAEEANSSHYGTIDNLIATDDTNMGCTENCHALGVSGGDFSEDYGNAISLDGDHNQMGAIGEACQKGCHNTDPSYNITLHDANMGIIVGASACYSAGCHSAPAPSSSRRRRR